MYFNTIQKVLPILYIIGADPREGFTKSQFFLYFYNIFSAIGMVYLLVLKFANAENKVTVKDITDAVICLFLFCHGMVKSTTMFVKKNSVQTLLAQMEKHFWPMNNYKYSYIHNGILNICKTIRNTTNFIWFMHFCNAMGFLVGPLITKDPVLPFECYRPEWMGYYTLLLFEDVTSIITILCPVLAMDVFFVTIIKLTQIQWKMLNSEIQSMFDLSPSGKISREDEENIMVMKIKKCVVHHNFLLNYQQLLNDTFSIPLFFFLIVIVLCMCVEMYVISTVSDWESLRTAIVYTATGCLEFMLCYCYPCQDLSDEADNISYSIYFSNWYRNPEYFRDTQLIMQKGQKLVAIRPGGFMIMDLKTGLSVGIFPSP
uniref:Odorant receptor n=1 Tax=Colaphellus bowringi TaxID=561076 RepID=A0A0S3J2S4_9CUCU|nr:odorant receptor OR37 [Colaphellus bowringi]